jgi:hypothetical protein
MIEQTLRAFCESRYRWAIVTTLTLLLGCALLVPLVDQFLSGQELKNTITKELDQAHTIAEGLDQFQERVSAQVTALQQLEAKAVTEESNTEIRKRLRSLARDHGCTMRKLQMGSVALREWYTGDDPLAASPEKPGQSTKTPFLLERWPLTMTVSGAMGNVRNMLDQMNRDGMLVHTKSLELFPDGQDGRNVTMQTELWYFALRRKAG